MRKFLAPSARQEPRRLVSRIATASLTSDVVTVLEMIAPLKTVPQRADPLLPWTETTHVDLGQRGSLVVRHTPDLESSGGVPVVLLHGITLTADVNFFALANLFGPTRPAIVFDLPNHGSGIKVDHFDFDDVADDVVAVLDHLGVPKAVVCGYSLGGIVAMVVANRHPGRVAGLVVQAAAMRYGVDVRERTFLRAVAAIDRFGLNGVARDLPVRYWRATARHSADAAARWRWLKRQLSSSGDVRFATVFRAVQRADHRHLTSAVPAAVLLLKSDRVCSPRLQREVADTLGARAFELDADHDLPVADPVAYAAITDAALRWIDTSITRGVR